MDEMMAMMQEMNKKIDMMMGKMGCKSMPKEEYFGMSEEQKDMKDEKDMTGM